MGQSGKPIVFIIVLNFNGKDTLTGCLSSIYQSDYPDFEVIVIDNNSRDGSFEQAKNSFSRAHFIKNSANLGFSKGNNVGIRYALEKFADYVLLLNNDAFIERTALSALINSMSQNPSAGIASPLILGADEKIWFAGGMIDWKKMRTVHLDKKKSDNPYPTEYISGCAMLVKKEVFKKIGLLDERFFLYYEDADFSVRAERAGFDLLIVPAARVRHLEQSNQKNDLKTYWLVLSALIFFRERASFLNKLWMFLYVPARKIKNFYDLFFAKNETARDVRRAYKDFKKVYKS